MRVARRSFAPGVLELPLSLRSQLEAFSAARYPHEACGLLLGRRSSSSAIVTHVREARNIEAERPHERYDLDPADHFAAEELARELDLEVVGIWHSHPDRAAQPSESDRAQAWTGWSYVIVSATAGSSAEIRSWRLMDQRFVEERLTERASTPALE